MKSSFGLFLIAITTAFLGSCYKNELKEYVPPKVETARDIFYKIPGLYQVSDTALNYSYTMRVAFFQDTPFERHYKCRSLTSQWHREDTVLVRRSLWVKGRKYNFR